MPTPLPAPYIANVGQTIQAHRMGQADRLAEQQRGVLKQAGQQAAEGSLGQARKSLLYEGMFKEADHIGQMIRQVDADKLAKVKKTYDVLGNLARTADTPEKWQQMIQIATQGGMDVAKYADFGMRDLVLAQSDKIGEHLNYELQNRGLDIKQQALDYKMSGVDPESRSKSAKMEQGLRKEYTQLSKNYREMRDGLDRVRAGSKLNTGAGDVATVFGYMKTLDPNSTVREGEFATAEQTSGLPGQVVSMYNKIISGERLTPEQRQNFVKAAEELARSKVEEQDRIKSQFGRIAESSGLAPERVLTDFGDVDLGGGSDESAAAPNPRARNPQTGEEIEFNPQSGQWEPVQ